MQRWLLSLGLLLGLASVQAAMANPSPSERCAHPNVWGGSALSTGVGGGSGTETDPYRLSAAAHFVSVSDYFAELVAQTDDDVCSTAHFRQDADVDLTAALSTFAWVPIGEDDDPFRGLFDGQGYAIEGFTLDSDRHAAGFFARTVNATVRNVVLSNVDVTFRGTKVGALIGHAEQTELTQLRVTGDAAFGATSKEAGGVIGKAKGVEMHDVEVDLDATGGVEFVAGIVGYAEAFRGSDVHVEGTLIISASGTVSYVGGMFGEVKYSRLTDSSARMNIDADIEYGNLVGGVAGKAENVEFEDITAHGIISGKSGVGGFAGETRTGTSLMRVSVSGPVSGHERVGGIGGDIEDSRVTLSTVVGTVQGLKQVGGVAGIADHAMLSSVLATTSVTADEERAGGLVGELKRSTVLASGANGFVRASGYAGGLVGEANDSTIEASFATGSVEAGELVGGLIGDVEGTRFLDVYATASVSGTDRVGGLFGRHQFARLERAYSAGSVTSSGTEVGGLIGFTNTRDASVTGSFWDVARSGRSDATLDPASYGTGVTTTELRSLATFQDAGWAIVDGAHSDDPDAVWGICPNESDPFLLWQVADDGTFTPSSVEAPTCVGADPATLPGDDATLSSLAASRGDLNPAFRPDRRSYEVIVPTGVERITLTAITRDAAASITNDGQGGARSVSVEVDATPGSMRTISLVVTAEDGVTRETYTVTVRTPATQGVAPTNLVAVPDDGAAWLAFTPPSEPITGLQVRIDDGPWTPFFPAVTTSPIRIPGLVNGRETQLTLRAMTEAGVGTPSTTVRVTPLAASAPPLELEGDMRLASVTEVDAGAGVRTVTIEATYANTGDRVLEGVWVRPTVRFGTITRVFVEDGRGSVLQLGDAWYWHDARLEPGATATLRLTATVEVQP